MGRVRFQRQVAEFVDDEQLWLRQREKFLVWRAMSRGPCAKFQVSTPCNE
ncbi:uncharacterized protein (DUF1499 family) [Bradyrhizobium sp. USDA 4486]